MHIGILQTGHLPDEVQANAGDYDAIFTRMLTSQGLEVSVWPVVDDVFPEGAHAADGWLITGSRHGAYENLPWIPKLEALVRDIHDAGLPMVGICFGHQIIAQALGGKVEKFAGGWAVGPHDYDWEGQTITLNAWHQDQVVELPKGARRIATSPFCENAALVYGDRIFTVQAHPEFDREVISTLMTTRAPGVVPEPVLSQAAANLDRPVHNSKLAEEIAGFFKESLNG